MKSHLAQLAEKEIAMVDCPPPSRPVPSILIFPTNPSAGPLLLHP